MVLADDDDAGDAAVLAGFRDLLGVERGRVEVLRVFITEAPFLVRERVRAEVKDGVDVVVAASEDTLGGCASGVEFREDGIRLLDLGVRVHWLCIRRRSGRAGEEKWREEGENRHRTTKRMFHNGSFYRLIWVERMGTRKVFVIGFLDTIRYYTVRDLEFKVQKNDSARFAKTFTVLNVFCNDI